LSTKGKFDEREENKHQTSSTKFQITFKPQYPNFKMKDFRFEFELSEIGIYLKFGNWDFNF